MAIFRRTIKIIISIISTATLLSACGGGSDSPDTTPDVFEFESAVNVEVSGTATSNEITIAGLTGDASLSISGGSYSFDGETFSTDDATIANEGTIRLRGVASSEFETTTTVTLTIGGVEGTFSITTEQEDTTPDTFDLGADETSPTAEEWVESDLITVQGINSSASISVENGEFYIVGVDTYPSSATTVENGQQISVRVQAGATLGDSEEAILTVGGISDSFSVTVVDGMPPVANVQFPTPNTLSDANFVTLRGQAQDDFGPVTSIQVVVTTDDGETEVDNRILSATENDDFQTTWSQRVNLSEGKVNTITVTATDDAGNVQSEPQVLTVTQSTTDINFPVGEDVFLGRYKGRGLAMDESADTLYVPITTNDSIFSVDISSGDRELFADLSGLSNSPNPNEILVLGSESILVSDSSNTTIYKSSLINPSFSVLSDNENENSDVSMSSPRGMALSSSGTVYVVDGLGYLYSVDSVSGDRVLISSYNDTEGSDADFDSPMSLILDEANNRALVVNFGSLGLMWVDLANGARTGIEMNTGLNEFKHIQFTSSELNQIILLETYDDGLDGTGALYIVDLVSGDVELLSGDSTPGVENTLHFPTGLVVDQEKKIAFVGANSTFRGTGSSIRVIDITNGERIVLTSSVED